MTIPNGSFDERFAYLDTCPRPAFTPAQQEVHAEYVVAFKCLYEAEVSLQQTHYLPEHLVGLRVDRFETLTYEKEMLFEELESWRRWEPQRRKFALEMLYICQDALTRVRARWEAAMKPRPAHFKWFVTAIADGGEAFACLLGPYDQPDQAATLVNHGRALLYRTHAPEAPWASYGVACADPATMRKAIFGAPTEPYLD